MNSPDSDKINLNLSKIIKTHFETLSYYNLYNFDIWITIIIILIVLIIVIYFFSINTLENQRANFEKNKCNPLFMPFASKINSEYQDDPSFNQNNFEQCLNETNFDLAQLSTSPLDGMFDSIINFFGYLSGLVKQFINFLMYLLGLLYKLYQLIIERLKIILSSMNNLFIGIANFFNHILGIISNLYYTIILLVDSVKYIFTVIALAFFSVALLPSMIITSSTYGLMVVALIIAAILHIHPIPIVPTFGFTFLWGFFAVALIIFLVALAITILFKLLYDILSDFAGNIIANGPSLPESNPTSSRDNAETDPADLQSEECSN